MDDLILNDEHPTVPTQIAFGVLGSDEFFITMEYDDGGEDGTCVTALLNKEKTIKLANWLSQTLEEMT